MSTSTDTQQEAVARATSPSPESATISVQGVSKWYGDVVAVSDVSFTVEPGVTALLGPNGAGKSTTLEMLTGVLRPSTGTIEIHGRPVRGDVDLYRRVGLVAEQEEIYPFLTGREFLHFNAVLQQMSDPEAAADRALEMVEMAPAADRRVGGYSKGMRQRIKVAAAMVHDPDILLLDEPLAGTDPLQRVKLIELINKLGAAGKTVLVSSHVLDEVERFADRILVIVNGKLAAAGDYRTIRDHMDEQANRIRVRCDDARRLAAALIRAGSTIGVHLEEAADGKKPSLVAETSDVRLFYRELPTIAKGEEVRLYEVAALDDSLASVFAYVVGR